MYDCVLYMRWFSESDAIFPFYRAFMKMLVVIQCPITFSCFNLSSRFQTQTQA